MTDMDDNGRNRRREPEEAGVPEGGSTPLKIKGSKIRFDAPPGDEFLNVADDGDILALFSAWASARQQAMPHVRVFFPDKDQNSGAERRDAPRYLPAESQAWIGWWHGSRFVVTPSELINLSKGGALLFLNERPPMGQPIWLCLGAPHPLEYVQARVLDAFSSPESPDYRVRLDFHIPCPLSFFLAAGHRIAST